jgi:hypothetical protein
LDIENCTNFNGKKKGTFGDRKKLDCDIEVGTPHNGGNNFVAVLDGVTVHKSKKADWSLIESGCHVWLSVGFEWILSKFERRTGDRICATQEYE